MERVVQFLKSGGKAAMIIADHILTNPGYKFVRKWLLENTRIFARISLPGETFQPFTGTKSHLVLFEKKEQDKKGLGTDSFQIFRATAKCIGHDNRGTPIYLRTPEGNEIIWEIEREIVRIINGKKETKKAKVFEKIIDDDMLVRDNTFESSDSSRFFRHF